MIDRQAIVMKGKTMRKTLCMIFLCGFAAWSLCACGETSGNTPEKVQVGVTYYNQTDTFLRELIDCYKNDLENRKTEDLEVTVMVREAAAE